ncbi:Variant SH3 domain containing protein [Histomonas meleagridis]|uniref:Variant SH3 domain containing protein n=1 Tax=Histomonas meleagridis TaxID=135588 RepID=UPI00355A54BF|nr:Variant SH3 domain containing protein [Histomonas meleagridis]
MPLSDTINNILDTGSKFNNLYIDLSKNIENTEEQLTKELLDAEKYFTKLKEDEYIVVYIASQLVIDIYNFIPNVKQEENKRVDAEFLMASRVDKIRELLCSLRDSVTNSRAFAKPIGMVPKSWEDEQTEPFYARVWKSFDTNKPGELKASKKSLVLVKNATQHAYWEVEKMNGEVGYFPCCLLEPLRE